MDADNAAWLTLVTGFIAASWLPHMIFSIRRYRREHTKRAFRGVFVAVMLEIGFVRSISAGAIVLVPGVAAIEFLLLALTAALMVMLLSGGIVLAFTWRADA